MQKPCPTVFLITCLLAAFAPSSSAQSFDNKRLSTEDFQRDQAIGITHILDPGLSRAIGARGFKIWVAGNALEQADYYLRISRAEEYLNVDFNVENFYNNTEDTFLNELDPSDLEWLMQRCNSNNCNPRSMPRWQRVNWIRRSYEELIKLRSYGHRFLNRTREFLFEENKNTDIRFIEPIGFVRGAVDEFNVKATKAEQNNNLPK